MEGDSANKNGWVHRALNPKRMHEDFLSHGLGQNCVKDPVVHNDKIACFFSGGQVPKVPITRQGPGHFFVVFLLNRQIETENGIIGINLA